MSAFCERPEVKPPIHFRQYWLQHLSIDIWDSSDIFYEVLLRTPPCPAATTWSAFLPSLPQGLPLSRRYHRVCFSTAANTGSPFLPSLPQGLLSTAATTGSAFLPSRPQGLPLSRHYYKVCLSTVATTGSALSRRYHRVCLCPAATTGPAFVPPLPQGLPELRRWIVVAIWEIDLTCCSCYSSKLITALTSAASQNADT